MFDCFVLGFRCLFLDLFIYSLIERPYFEDFFKGFLIKSKSHPFWDPEAMGPA